MARARVEVPVGDGIARFDVDPEDIAAVGHERVSRRGEATVAKLDESLDAALASTRPAAEAVLDAFRTLAPDELSVEFGVRVDAAAGAVFASAGIGAHFQVTLNWTASTRDDATTT